MIVVWLILKVPWVCLQFVIVVFPDHTHYFYRYHKNRKAFFSKFYHGHSELIAIYNTSFNFSATGHIGASDFENLS